MQLQQYKAATAAVWVLAVCAVGFALGVGSVLGLAVLATVAVLPLVVLMRVWHEPVPSMSESIHNARD